MGVRLRCWAYLQRQATLCLSHKCDHSTSVFCQKLWQIFCYMEDSLFSWWTTVCPPTVFSLPVVVGAVLTWPQHKPHVQPFNIHCVFCQKLWRISKNLSRRHEELFLQLMETCVSSYVLTLPAALGDVVSATSATVQHLSSVKRYEGYVETWRILYTVGRRMYVLLRFWAYLRR